MYLYYIKVHEHLISPYTLYSDDNEQEQEEKGDKYLNMTEWFGGSVSQRNQYTLSKH